MKRGTISEAALHRKRTPNLKIRDRLGRNYLDREKLIFAFMVRYAVDHVGHMPTLRQTATALNIPGIATVSDAIQSLVAQDKLRWLDGVIVIPGSKFEWTEATDAKDSVFAEVAEGYKEEWGTELAHEE